MDSAKPPEPFPPQEQGYQELAEGYHSLCRFLVIRLLENGAEKELVTELEGDNAQSMADFLNEMLDDGQVSLSQRERRLTLHFLIKLAKSAQVFPRCLELQNVQYDLGRPAAGGGFGVIYRGVHEGESVCVKAVIASEGGIEKHKMRAQAGELILLARLEHSNILPFSGIYFSEEVLQRVCIISPWMENGNLVQYMQRFPDTPPVPIVHDIISGLKYLHDRDIVHADMKAQNVLISGAGRAMLADFGISNVTMTSATTTMNSNGTTNWKAPELFLDDPTPTRECDIWAFACICYQIITGRPPFYEFRFESHFIIAFQKGNTVPRKPMEDGEEWDDIKETIWSIGERCWKRNPGDRPTAGELKSLIAALDLYDDRPKEPGYFKRNTNNNKVDYHQVFEILHKIRNSQDASSAKGGTASFEERLTRQFVEIQRQAQHMYHENKDLRVRNETLIGKLNALQRESDDRLSQIEQLRHDVENLKETLKTSGNTSMLRKLERVGRAESESIRSIATAPDIADEKMQEHIARVAKKVGRQCPSGFAWVKNANGYICGGGGHFISFGELGMT